MAEFMFATGIENSYPTIEWKGKTVRQDELAKTKHYERWRDDFGLLQEFGIEYLRYGPPYFSVHLGPASTIGNSLMKLSNATTNSNVTPIADLCHFGVPDWIGDFQNPDLPKLFVEYAEPSHNGFLGFVFIHPSMRSLLRRRSQPNSAGGMNG